MWNSVLGKESKGALRIIADLLSGRRREGDGSAKPSKPRGTNYSPAAASTIPTLSSPTLVLPHRRSEGLQDSSLFLVLKSFKLIFLEGPYEKGN